MELKYHNLSLKTSVFGLEDFNLKRGADIISFFNELLTPPYIDYLLS